MIRYLLTLCLLTSAGYGSLYAQQTNNKVIAAEILGNSKLDTTQSRALVLLNGFSAGTSYNEVWIRDFNTFIKGSLKVHPKETVKQMLLLFFKIQGTDGNIVDGLVDTSKAHGGYAYRYSELLPTWAGHKNTVETDQESSLIQAVRKYIDVTGDTSILQEKIDGKTVTARMEDALKYVLKDRWSAKYGLVTGATTIDWGDVQPETGWGVAINKKTKWAIDIYDNAMYVIALHDFLAIKPKQYKTATDWAAIAGRIKTNVRKHLWSAAGQKYIPHIYLNGSPFSKGFDEKNILYTGGSICAIMAGFNTPAEVKAINRQMREAAAKEKFATIGITVYPPYPEKEFPNMKPYLYQNAGDWTWFGGRITSALLPYNMAPEAYEDLKPMVDRAIQHKGFYEWYDVQTGQPKGSGDFRGEAGVLYDAITQLKDWAAKHK
ncbi:hypothetical protein GWR56_18575 [Mucilaginibacter sp. 14171R-50]|uniref:hypothetical protein n=1 Tax=Mucilaginibacter sp. 14171R-50 TaxID=2703789 RepID=UPI00138CC383|nr:hypothetical protein [Mucilaginibacter sp. 14171R-50]QHS57451.1 hypothetical protein GWR56_18575 [Mucilaginibacter sp. 14171R-50]